MTQTVRIRLKLNPENARTVTARSWANYDKRKWELAEQQETTQTLVQKKSVNAERVGKLDYVVDTTEVKDSITKAPDFVPPLQDDDLVDSQAFVNPVDSELDDLRKQYADKFGKPADKRMKEEKLKQLINETV